MKANNEEENDWGCDTKYAYNQSDEKINLLDEWLNRLPEHLDLPLHLDSKSDDYIYEVK